MLIAVASATALVVSDMIQSKWRRLFIEKKWAVFWSPYTGYMVRSMVREEYRGPDGMCRIQ